MFKSFKMLFVMFKLLENRNRKVVKRKCWPKSTICIWVENSGAVTNIPTVYWQVSKRWQKASNNLKNADIVLKWSRYRYFQYLLEIVKIPQFSKISPNLTIWSNVIKLCCPMLKPYKLCNCKILIYIYIHMCILYIYIYIYVCKCARTPWYD